MYELNRKAKFIINSKEVYSGVIVKIEKDILMLEVVDWQDRFSNKPTAILIVPISQVVVKYEAVQ